MLTNLHPWEIPETEPPTKEHTWVGPMCLKHLYHKTAFSGLSGRRCFKLFRDSIPQEGEILGGHPLIVEGEVCEGNPTWVYQGVSRHGMQIN